MPRLQKEAETMLKWKKWPQVFVELSKQYYIHTLGCYQTHALRRVSINQTGLLQAITSHTWQSTTANITG
jgi:hypothetical protein